MEEYEKGIKAFHIYLAYIREENFRNQLVSHILGPYRICLHETITSLKYKLKSIKDMLVIAKELDHRYPHDECGLLYKTLLILRVDEMEQEVKKRDEVLINMVLINTELKRHLSN